MRAPRFDHLDRAECDRIERNRAKAPTTVLLAAIVFELIADARRSIYSLEGRVAALEDVAIQVDGWAQDGHEVVQAEVDHVARQVNLILGLPLACGADLWPHGSCGKTNVPGQRRCIAHTTHVLSRPRGA
jgi:hypothetical protein